MPAGLGLGYAYFLATKFVGYTAFCHWVLNPQILRSATGNDHKPDSAAPSSIFFVRSAESALQTDIPTAWKAGVIRTLIGLGAGAIVGIGFWSIPYLSNRGDSATWIFFVLLVPVRVGEWALLFKWVYRTRPFADPGNLKLITFGLLTSFALDAIGVIAAFVFLGGMWIC
jgi:hypothetical protein